MKNTSIYGAFSGDVERNQMRRIVLTASAVLLLAACAGLEATGTVDGKTFPVKDGTTVVTQRYKSATGQPVAMEIYLGSALKVCDAVTTNTVSKNSTELILDVFNAENGADAPLAAGTYELVEGQSNGKPGAFAQFVEFDEKCFGTRYLAKGSVTISAVSDTSVSGTYDLQFFEGNSSGQQAGSLKGSFDVSVCAEAMDVMTVTPMCK